MHILPDQAFQTIADRPAAWKEALSLMATGWGSIFIVIIILMLMIYLLNRAFRKRK
ncbi:MAG: OadG-related small transporter subunit [Faecousia sp.]